MDDDALVRLASRGTDDAAAYATNVHRLMQLRITQVHVQGIRLRTAQAIASDAAADTSRRGQTLLAPLSAAIAAHHQFILSALVAEVIAYGTTLGARIPDDVVALAAPATD